MKFYDVNDVMKFLDCSESYAYKIIKKLRKELEHKGYENGPSGKISEKYFKEKFYYDNEKS